MNILKDRMAGYTLPQQVQAMGLYPYFRVIGYEGANVWFQQLPGVDQSSQN